MKQLTMPIAGLVTTIVVIVLGIADLVLIVTTGAGGSVSNFMVQAGFKAPMMVFAFGFVCGHLFGYMKLEKEDA